MDDGRRIGRGIFGLGLIILAGLLGSALSTWGRGPAVAGLGVVAFLAVLPLASWRIRDVARGQDDMIWVLTPVVNLAFLLVLCFTPTPGAEQHGLRASRSRARMSAVEAYRAALPWLAPSARLVVPLLIVHAAVASWLHPRFVTWAMTMFSTHGAGEAAWREGASALAFVLSLYTLMQLVKRKTASRGSWWPSLLLMPTLLFWGGAGLAGLGNRDMGVAVLALFDQALVLTWDSFVGAALVMVMLLTADAARRGTPMGVGELVAWIRANGAGVTVAHGVRLLMVVLGLQVIVPGVWYALSFAFTDMLAVFEPDRPALRASNRLARGIRTTVAKIFAAWLLVGGAIHLLSWAALMSREAMATAVFDATTVPWLPGAISDLAWGLCGWWCTLAVLALYRERMGLLEAVEAREAATP